MVAGCSAQRAGPVSQQADPADRAAGAGQRDRHRRRAWSPPRLGPQLDQNIIVENKPGAAFTIGLDIVAKAPPDGYTLGHRPGRRARHQPEHGGERLPYNLEKDFQPIALISARPSAARGVADLRIQVGEGSGRRGEGQSRQAHQRVVGNGSPGHVGGELFKYMTGIEVVHVPYRGGAAAINDLIAGRVDFMFESLNSISPHAKSGKVRALAVSGDRRSPAFPGPADGRGGGRAGLQRADLERRHRARRHCRGRSSTKLNAAVNRAIRTPAFKERFGPIGDEPAGGTPEEFAATIAERTRQVERRGAALRREDAVSATDGPQNSTSSSSSSSGSVSRRLDPFLHLRHRHDGLAIGGAGAGRA